MELTTVHISAEKWKEAAKLLRRDTSSISKVFKLLDVAIFLVPCHSSPLAESKRWFWNRVRLS
jgi:hypothetical protein